MSESTDRQFEEANAAVAQAVTEFLSEVDLMIGRWDAVDPTYILMAVLMDLSSGLSDLGEDLEPAVGPATRKLLAALVEYRDLPLEDR